ncbi:MAG: thiol oxidoreductase [Leptospiraceae bacterium]|nr:thiol oxidoreductase [Leptospiraceae bacterium]
MRYLLLLLIVFIVSCTENLHEAYSGGETTVFDRSLNAFNKIASNIKEQEKVLSFNRGNQIFKALWSNDGISPFQGLGPLHNSNSCNGCHFLGGRGRNRYESETIFHSLIFKIKTKDNSLYGLQLQDKSIPEVSPEAVADLRFEEIKGSFPDGETFSLRKPIYSFSRWAHKPPVDLDFSPRVAPVIYGMGLLSLISEAELQTIADPEDKNKDGISGRLNRVFHLKTKQVKIGRFGWKANQPDIEQLIALALHEDMGITSRLIPYQNCTEKQRDCKKAQSFGPEIDPNMFKDLLYYTMLVAVPAARNVEREEFKEGKHIFKQLSCDSCHKPKFTTIEDKDFPELSKQKIRPYTDLLLHEMGDDLADGYEDGEAKAKEWRTSPLWGIGLYLEVSQHSELLHDGRARGIQEAILWHGGEAQKSKETFMNLPKTEREKLLYFLQSL